MLQRALVFTFALQRYILYTYYANNLTIFNTLDVGMVSAVRLCIEPSAPSARREERAASERATSEQDPQAEGGQPKAVSRQPCPRRWARPSRRVAPPSATCLRSGVARRRVCCPVVPVAPPAPRCSPLLFLFFCLARALLPSCGVASGAASRAARALFPPADRAPAMRKKKKIRRGCAPSCR